jgi:hypothetical protein
MHGAKVKILHLLLRTHMTRTAPVSEYRSAKALEPEGKTHVVGG